MFYIKALPVVSLCLLSSAGLYIQPGSLFLFFEFGACCSQVLENGLKERPGVGLAGTNGRPITVTPSQLPTETR